jgi:hypothetical protein
MVTTVTVVVVNMRERAMATVVAVSGRARTRVGPRTMMRGIVATVRRK